MPEFLKIVVNLPESLKTVRAYAFSGCTGLKELELPDSITTIGYRAFEKSDSTGGGYTDSG